MVVLSFDGSKNDLVTKAEIPTGMFPAILSILVAVQIYVR